MSRRTFQVREISLRRVARLSEQKRSGGVGRSPSRVESSRKKFGNLWLLLAVNECVRSLARPAMEDLCRSSRCA